MQLKDIIAKKPLIFDGGMGTYYAQKSKLPARGVELASIENPELIAEIHAEYIAAGAQAIKTNTFVVNRLTYQGDEVTVRKIIAAAYKLAQNAAYQSEREIFVFADIGPIIGLSEQQTLEEYRFVVDCFLELGANNFLFETNATAAGLKEIARYIKEKNPDSFIVTSFSAYPGGFTRDGYFIEDIVRDIAASKVVDAVGFNCISGVRQLEELLRGVSGIELPLSLMPNAGHPVVSKGQTIYETDPAYFGEALAELAGKGVRILGGCCGTTPEYIKSLTAALSDVVIPADFTVRVTSAAEAESTRIISEAESPFWEKLQTSAKPIAVELDPPENSDIAKYIAGANELKAAGIDVITIADGPIARARMDSSLLACKLQRELGIETIPHMACRDRNLNATKALLLGLSAEGIRNILHITGDPVPSVERDEVKSVYQFNSRKLATFTDSLGKRQDVTPFHIFGALNVNAKFFDGVLGLARKKIESGMVGFFTQPVLSERAKENLKRAHEELDAYILGGLMPIVSERNARFMASEIAGIYVDEDIIDAYSGLDREAAEKLALDMTVKFAREIADFIDGYYIITPFSRTKLVSDIVRHIKEQA